MMVALDFEHVFIPGDDDALALLLLHGTGGDQHDLIGLGQAVMPQATILSPRGKVLENGMPRFFRRLAEGVFDLEDLKFRTDELADFIAAAKQHYNLADKKIIALGFSNGANIAASIFLQRPEALYGVVLLRAMVTFEPEALPDLSGKPVLMLSGLMDQIIPVENTKKLAAMFEQARANVTLTIKPAGHGLTSGEVPEIAAWLEKLHTTSL